MKIHFDGPELIVMDQMIKNCVTSNEIVSGGNVISIFI